MVAFANIVCCCNIFVGVCSYEIRLSFIGYRLQGVEQKVLAGISSLNRVASNKSNNYGSRN